MSKYTRRHYMDIGNLIRKLPKSKRRTEYAKWNRIFKKDNPRYKSKMFREWIGL